MKIYALIIGAEMAVIGLVTHYLLHKYDTLWLTILGIWLLSLVNFLSASISYYLETKNTLTMGDLYISQHGGLNFNFPIILITASLLYYSYFTGEDAGSFTSTLTLTYCIFMYYSRPVEETNKENDMVDE